MRLLCERSDGTSLVTIKNGIKVAHPIISEALEELGRDNFITIQKNFVALTEPGKEKAKTILKKHLVLEDYFEKTRSKIEAHTAAHIIEHYISGEVLNNLKKLLTLKKEGVPLTRFELNKEGLIAEITFSDYKLFERSVSMGLFPGEKIMVISEIPNGIVLEVRDKKFVLHKNIAERIKAVEYGKL